MPWADRAPGQPHTWRWLQSWSIGAWPPRLRVARTAAGFLAGAKCIATADLGGPYKAYVFDSGSSRIAVVWKWMGAPVELMPEKGCAGELVFLHHYSILKN